MQITFFLFFILELALCIIDINLSYSEYMTDQLVSSFYDAEVRITPSENGKDCHFTPWNHLPVFNDTFQLSWHQERTIQLAGMVGHSPTLFVPLILAIWTPMLLPPTTTK